MELNVNVKIDVGDKTIGLVGTLISAARTLAGAEVKDAEAVEVKPTEVAAKAAETVETAEEKPAKKTSTKKTAKKSAKKAEKSEKPAEKPDKKATVKKTAAKKETKKKGPAVKEKKEKTAE